MNKFKLRVEAELTRLGFVKVEPDYWAWFSIPRDRTITRLDVVLAGAVTATYNKGSWTVGHTNAARCAAIGIHKPEDVEVALNLLRGK